MRRVMFPSATTVKRVSARGGSLHCRGGDHPKLLKAELLVSSCVCGRVCVGACVPLAEVVFNLRCGFVLLTS